MADMTLRKDLSRSLTDTEVDDNFEGAEDGSRIKPWGGTRTLANWAADIINVKNPPYNAKGDGSDDSAAFAAAIAAADAGDSFKWIYVPTGRYNLGSALSMPTGSIGLFGEQYAKSGDPATSGGADRVVIYSSAADIFQNAGAVSDIHFENIAFLSLAGGGHIFNLNNSPSASVSKMSFRGVSFEQDNTDKSMIKAPTSGSFFDVLLEDFRFNYPINTSVPMFDFNVTGTLNNIRMSKFRSTYASTSSNTGTYAIACEVAAGKRAENITIEHGVVQQPLSGFVDIVNPRCVSLRHLSTYDSAVAPGNPIINIRDTTANQLDEITIEHCNISEGDATNSSVKVASQSSAFVIPLTILNSRLAYLDLGGNFMCLAINSTISALTTGARLTTLNNRDVEICEYGQLLTVPHTGAQITSNKNDYSPQSPRRGGCFRLSTDASRTITGFRDGEDGRVLRIVNVGSNNLVIANESASSTASRRVITGTGADITMGANEWVEMMYDGTSERWRVFNNYP